MTHASPMPWMDDSLLDVLPLPACICEAPSGRIIGCNPHAIALWGQRPGAEASIHELLRFVDAKGFPLNGSEDTLAVVMAASERPVLIEQRGGGTLRGNINVVPIRRADGRLDTRLMVFHRANGHNRQDTLLDGQTRIIEMIARGAPLATIMDAIAHVIEEHAEGTAIASLLLLAPDGLHLRHAGAPALPDAFKKTIEALEIGPQAGTCGAAAWRRRPVLTEDIEHAVEWGSSVEAPLAVGLRAAWSTPIVSSSKRLVGTIGVYFRERRSPSPDEREVVELLAPAAAIAIERQHAADATLEADRRRDEFLAMLAHELRNPLAPIRTAAQLLGLTEADNALTAKVQGVIERQVHNLTRIIDDLLDVSRITRGAITLQTATTDVGTVVRHAVETALSLMQKRDHRLTAWIPPEPIHVCADAARLEQVIVNLLANAAKFTPRGGDVSIRVVPAVDGRVTIAVTDNGRGIPATLIPYVFDMFMQGSRTLDRAEGGLGIGLTVAHRLVEMHGGTLEVRSEGSGFGSQFTVTLPRVAGHVEAEPCGPMARPTPARRILVVEDQPDAAEMLALMLRTQDHDVRVAHDGHAALVAAAAFQPDVMLIDIGLPGMSGYDLAERIRRDPAHAHVMLVAVTGYSGLPERQRALASGFDQYLAKPVDERALAEMIESGRH